VRRESVRHLAGGKPSLGSGDSPAEIDLQRLHAREVEHDPVLADAVTGGAMAAATDGQLDTALSRERDDACDAVGVEWPDDHRRSAVDQG
jgi:hypothetical protein